MNDKVISIVIVSDNHLAAMLAALLKSIEVTHLGPSLIDIYIVNDGISKRNINKINKTIRPEKVQIIWKDLKDIIPKGVSLPKDKSTYPLCIFARFFIPVFLDKSIRKAIYLDVDMLVLRDIEHLWDADLDGKALGAVLSRSKTVGSTWGGIRNYSDLGLAKHTKYFNSGLLVMDLDKCRALKISDNALSILEANKQYVTFPDQYALNVIFANAWYELDARWNNYSQSTNSDPFIIHFTQVKPIFKSYNYNLDYQTLFLNTLDLTPWNNFRLKSNLSWQLKRISNLIAKGLWSVLFSKLVSIRK